MDTYDGWAAIVEQRQRDYNRDRILPRLATDELVAELNRRGYEVAYTDPELGTRVVEVDQ